VCVLQMRARVNGVCSTHNVCVLLHSVCILLRTHTHARRRCGYMCIECRVCVLQMCVSLYEVWCVCMCMWCGVCLLRRACVYYTHSYISFV